MRPTLALLTLSGAATTVFAQSVADAPPTSCITSVMTMTIPVEQAPATSTPVAVVALPSSSTTSTWTTSTTSAPDMTHNHSPPPAISAPSAAASPWPTYNAPLNLTVATPATAAATSLINGIVPSITSSVAAAATTILPSVPYGNATMTANRTPTGATPITSAPLTAGAAPVGRGLSGGVGMAVVLVIGMGVWGW